MIPEIFIYSFMQRAFIIGNIIAISCPLIGVFLVLKRLSLVGNTLSHVALAGVAIGMVLGIYPIYTALLVSIFSALGIEELRKNYKDYAELSLSIMLSAGLGLATIIISLLNNNSGIFSYLFGSISLVTTQDIYIIIPLAIAIIGVISLFYYGFFFLSFNEGDAKLAGVPVKKLNLLFILLVSITVSLAMRIVGGLLVSSLITLPVATSMQVAKSFKETVFYSIAFSILSVNTGLILSFYYDLASGGAIIISSIIYLLFVLVYKKTKKILNKNFEKNADLNV